MKISLFFGGAAYNSKADNSGARTVSKKLTVSCHYVLWTVTRPFTIHIVLRHRYLLTSSLLRERLLCSAALAFTQAIFCSLKLATAQL